MYGSGLRLMEVCRLRVKDIDFERQSVFVRDGKGKKQRITTLADHCVPVLQRQVEKVPAVAGRSDGDSLGRGVFALCA